MMPSNRTDELQRNPKKKKDKKDKKKKKKKKRKYDGDSYSEEDIESGPPALKARHPGNDSSDMQDDFDFSAMFNSQVLNNVPTKLWFA